MLQLDQSAPDAWDRHWSKLSAPMQANPAVLYRRRQALGLLRLAGCGGPVRFLDFGCGEGTFAAELLGRYPEVQFVGVDQSDAAVRIAQRRAPEARFEQIDLFDVDGLAALQLLAWAEYALCSEVLEHVDDPVQLLRQLLRCMQSGAQLVVTVPGGPMSALDRHLGHRKHYTRSLLVQELHAAGFRSVRAFCAGFPFHNLYRGAVVMRGQAIIHDAQAQPAGWLAAAYRLAHWSFRLNLPSSPWGWQLLALATAP